MLGTNDSSISRNVLPDEYKNNLQSMIDGLKSIGVKKVILNRSPYVLPTAANHDDQALVKMAGYMEVIKELVDGETVLLGDIEAYNYFEANQNQLSDGIHPTPAGYQQLGIFWANAYTRLLIDPYESGFAQFITNGNQHT
jgi:lysophospholipase L1-like esterase